MDKGEIAENTRMSSFEFPIIILSHIFDAPKETPIWNVGKEAKCWQSAISHFHILFCTQGKTNVLSNIEFVVGKYFQVGQG